MSLVPMKSLLEEAEKRNIAIGAFSVGNMEMVMGAVAAAEELNAPIILQIAEVRLKNSPLELMATASFNCLANAAKGYCDSHEQVNFFDLSKSEAEGVYENVKRHIKIFEFID